MLRIHYRKLDKHLKILSNQNYRAINSIFTFHQQFREVFSFKSEIGVLAWLLRFFVFGHFRKFLSRFNKNAWWQKGLKAYKGLDTRVCVYNRVVENQSTISTLLKFSVKIASREKENKMSATNLSVCFGPVFMWKEEESCEAIFDVRFQCTGIALKAKTSLSIIN